MHPKLVSSEANSEFFSFNYYQMIVRKHIWQILLCILLSVFVTLAYLKTAIPKYQATTKIQADPVQPNSSAQDQFLMSSMIFLFYETQYEIIQSRKVAETVVDKLDLINKFEDKKSENNTSFGDSIITVLKNLIPLTLIDRGTPRSDIDNEQSKKDSIARFIQSNLSVKGGTQSQIINLSFVHEDPKMAADIVNSVSEAYIDFGLESRLNQIKHTADWLSEQSEELRLTLQESEDKLRKFRLSQDLVNTEQQQRISNTQLQTLNTELVKAQTQLSESQNLFQQVTQIEKDNGDYRSLGPVLQNSTVRDLVKEEAVLRRRVEELSERYGPKHPKLIAAKSDFNSANAALNSEVNKVVENIKKQYQAALTQEKSIKKLISESRNELQSYQGSSFELTRLEREVDNNRRIYESFLSKLTEADVSGNYEASNIRVIDKATVPDQPISPRPFMSLVLSITVGLLIGIAWSIFKELTGRTFKTPDQMEAELGLTTLGITPLVKTRSKISPENQYIMDNRSTFSESINSIRTGILFGNIDSPPQTILITSSLSSEGKSTLSINLAAALAKLDSTILVELDLRKPVLSKFLNLENEKGILNTVEGESLDNCIQKLGDKAGFDVILSGGIPKEPSEILASKKFKEVIDNLKLRYKYIILDTPPVLPVTDACIISRDVDSIIVAVRAEKTTVSMAKESITRLQKVNINVTGLVMTQAEPNKMKYYGDHYYQDEYYGVN